MKSRAILVKGFVTVLACAVISLSFFLITSPITLQKILSLKPQNGNLTLYYSKFSAFDAQDISDFIGSIPYKNDPADSWFVDPKLKYIDTILAGNGNCSNMAFGAMYSFIESKNQAAIVYLFKKDYGFLYGNGHTVMSVNMENQNIILDLLEGGIPLQNQNYIDAEHFKYNKKDIFYHNALNDRKDTRNKYFTHNYLQGVVELGMMPQNEIVDYFNFLNRFYVSLGHTYLEKLIYDTLSLMFGYYPNTYVGENFFWQTYNNARLEVFFAYIFLGSFHLLYMIFFLLLVNGALNIYKNTNKNFKKLK